MAARAALRPPVHRELEELPPAHLVAVPVRRSVVAALGALRLLQSARRLLLRLPLRPVRQVCLVALVQSLPLRLRHLSVPQFLLFWKCFVRFGNTPSVPKILLPFIMTCPRFVSVSKNSPPARFHWYEPRCHH